ncbi:hypothetical protein [Mycolicibacterium pyrenivorans]|uniref:hypothetical protein n=1 Tax=Mycolicibacterium pyrenivorans TaxID=187102 RepID=UPI0021F26AC2|nr:hypothetical protein [Mycolicibacterium pyrenivorans]MCV7150814.1 hypothetical protein [Mycolicibacterium pyrenivorans]
MKALALAIAGAAIAIGGAPVAAAAPDCTDIGSTVTYCETNGSTQLITTPPPWNYGGWQGIGFWPLVGGFGLGE